MKLKEERIIFSKNWTLTINQNSKNIKANSETETETQNEKNQKGLSQDEVERRKSNFSKKPNI